jgi:hypothetical protein
VLQPIETPNITEETSVGRKNMIPSLECLDPNFNAETCNIVGKIPKRKSKSLNKLMQITILAIGIEGMIGNEVEIAWSLYDVKTGEQTAELHYLSPKNPTAVTKEARYCHGIDARDIPSHKKEKREAVLENLKRVAKSRENIVVVSADESPNSDIAQLVQDWNVHYVNIPLPPWRIRTRQNAHIEAQRLKESGIVEYEGATCEYQRIHRVQLADYSGNRASGAHCALLDVAELVQHIKDNGIHQYLTKLQCQRPTTPLNWEF